MDDWSPLAEISKSGYVSFADPFDFDDVERMVESFDFHAEADAHPAAVDGDVVLEDGEGRPVEELVEARRREGEEARLALGLGRELAEDGLEAADVHGDVVAEGVVRLADLGRKRVIQRRFNVAVPRARVPKKDVHVRDRSER